jgi:eukaryotic-like serine/threonine-protein kinase
MTQTVDSRQGFNHTPLYRYRFGGAVFDESRFELEVNGTVVELQLKPLQVLGQLLAHAGEVVSREELLEEVWAGRVIVEHVLTNAVAKLRKALGEIDGERLLTVPRIGYRLTGSVEKVAVGTVLASRLDLKIGAMVAGREHFVLERQLSASGGAEVWLARRGKAAERRVYKFTADAERLRTLKREVTLYRVLREGLGERDDLIRILDWNFETPPFYLECEYGGPDLMSWAATDGALSQLSREERIALFVQFAEAVAAAHGVGVLHKDLKPSNILIARRIDGSLQARAADFGSGRMLDPQRLEALGITRLDPPGVALSESEAAESGTVIYLAPELIAGKPPTVQSDLYALGMILYQMLMGDLRRPMTAGWEQGIADELLVEDIGSSCHGDPVRRLRSVADLVERLKSRDARRAAAESTRISLRRAAEFERALERARTRRPWVVAALVALLLGVGISTALYLEEKTARLEAARAAGRAEAINRFLADDLLGAADPSGPGGAHNPTMRDVLARTASHLDGRFANDPETKASIDLALGTAYFGLTDYASAEKYRAQALEVLKAGEGDDSTAALEAQYQLISVMVQTNRLDEAQRRLESADRLAGARLAQNSHLAFQAHWTRAGYYKLRMSVSDAAREYAAADHIRASIDPDNDTLLLRLRDALSWCYVRQGRNADAEQVLRDLMTPNYPPQRVGPLFWAQARIDYGIALKNLNRDEDAERVMSAALTELRDSLGPDHFFVAVVQNELGDLYIRQTRWEAAVQSLQEAQRILRQRTGEHGQATLIVGANLGIVLYRTGQFAQAVGSLSGVRTELVSLLGESSPQAQSVSFYLAASLAGLGRYSDAAPLLQNLQSADLASAEPRDDWAPRLDAMRGSVLLGLGLKADAVALLEPALKAMQERGTPSADLAPFILALARAQHDSPAIPR